ncbi:MAG: hypothetical protein IPM29_01610 [Planctomycetes bacterium]|nr:hypothetical protein [Planctomycetota bacterium]
MVLRNPIEASPGGGDSVIATGIGPSREDADAANRPYLEIEFGTSFGAGCASAGGPPVLAFAGGAPAMAQSFTLRTSALPVGSRPTVLIGGSDTWWNGPLPLDLGSIGLPGCWLLVAPDGQVHFPPTTATAFDARFVVPADPSLSGLGLFAQTAAVGPAGSFHMTSAFGFDVY